MIPRGEQIMSKSGKRVVAAVLTSAVALGSWRGCSSRSSNSGRYPTDPLRHSVQGRERNLVAGK